MDGLSAKKTFLPKVKPLKKDYSIQAGTFNKKVKIIGDVVNVSCMLAKFHIITWRCDTKPLLLSLFDATFPVSEIGLCAKLENNSFSCRFRHKTKFKPCPICAYPCQT